MRRVSRWPVREWSRFFSLQVPSVVRRDLSVKEVVIQVGELEQARNFITKFISSVAGRW